MTGLIAVPYDPDVDCSCPPPWNGDNRPNPTCVQHGEQGSDD